MCSNRHNFNRFYILTGKGDAMNLEKEGGGMPLLAQSAEDWLFAYSNAHDVSRPVMWPHLVEAVEELIAEARRIDAQQATDDCTGESSQSNLPQSYHNGR